MTTARFLDQIDWQRPWLAPLRSTGQAIASARDWRRALNDAVAAHGLCNHRGLPLQFVPQADLPHGMAYEAFISATGGVPTRENLHDFFNALVWLTFPNIKVRLNALQAAEIERAGVVPHRGKLRDGATIFDENAALLITRDADLIASLRSHQWQEIFVTHRAVFWRNCDVVLFGHALMEKLVTPYKTITAHTWVVEAGDAFFAMSPADRMAWIDASIAAQLNNGVVTADFTPLPVLGVPGWWHEQDNAFFYRDAAIFRPKRNAVG